MEKRVPKRVAEIQVTYSAKIKKEERYQVKCSQDSYEILRMIYPMDRIEYQEFFYVMFLNRSNEVLGYRQICSGTQSGCLVDVKMIMGVACKVHSSSLIVSHSHPTGSLAFSRPDIELTKKIKEACKVLDIVLLDHVIITRDSFVSAADEAIL